jgi:hypothetical protein
MKGYAMTTRHKVSLYLYLLVCMLGIGGGIVYVSVSTMMPYHLQALGVPWDELPDGVQAMLWLSVKVIGGLLLSICAVTLVLLLIPFRRNERWAKFSVFMGGILPNALLLGATIYLRYKTGAATPIALMSVSTGIVILSLFLSLDYKKT